MVSFNELLEQTGEVMNVWGEFQRGVVAMISDLVLGAGWLLSYQ